MEDFTSTEPEKINFSRQTNTKTKTNNAKQNKHRTLNECLQNLNNLHDNSEHSASPTGN